MNNYIVKFSVTINDTEQTTGQVGVICEPKMMNTNVVKIEIEAYYKKFKGNNVVEVEILDSKEVSAAEYDRELPNNLPIDEDM
jgi:hypothetical protein